MKQPEAVKHPARAPARALLRRLPVWAGLAAALAAGPFEDARAGCREVAKPLQEALAARDLEGARRHYKAVDDEFGCPDTFRVQAARAVSNLHAQVARERLAGGASLASQRALLEQGRSYAGTWLTLALLGDAARDVRDYARAAELYQGAITAMEDEVETPQPPPRADIERYILLANQSRMLAGRYVESPTTRAGKPGGLSARSVRGVKIEAVAVPITFKTGKAEFDEPGRKYAAAMAREIKQAEALAQDAPEQAPRRITLTAHTDERGSDAYNLELSRRRGEAVRRFLEAQGVTLPIEVIAKGESQPLELYDPGHYGQEEVWRMNRRVEWVR